MTPDAPRPAAGPRGRPVPRRHGVLRPGAAAVLALGLGTLTGCGGPDSLEGTVVSASGTGDRPLGGGWVAALTDDELRDFLGTAGIDVPGAADLPYVGGRVLRDGVTQAGGTLATVDQDGRFALTVTGRHTVCRLVEAPQVDVLKGCAVLDLPAQGTLELSVGDDGLRAALDG